MDESRRMNKLYIVFKSVSTIIKDTASWREDNFEGFGLITIALDSSPTVKRQEVCEPTSYYFMSFSNLSAQVTSSATAT